jgi:hypothetical protein
MTFHSLYRRDQRGRSTACSSASRVDDWTIGHLREHARQAIEATGEPIDRNLFDRFATGLTRQDSVEETLRIVQPLLDTPPPAHSYAPGSWGSAGGRGSARRWHS